MANCGLDGKLLSTHTERCRIPLTLHCCFAGELPKELPVVSLEVLNFGDSIYNTNKFTGGVPSEWGALTNLRKLKMVACGLNGKPLSIRTEHLLIFADFY